MSLDIPLPRHCFPQHRLDPITFKLATHLTDRKKNPRGRKPKRKAK